MVEFTDQPIVTPRRGARRVQIHPDVVRWCEDTYKTGKALEAPMDPAGEDTAGFMRMLRIYGNRQKKAVDTQWIEIDGEPHLRFRMRDKKVYNRAPLPREAAE